MTVLTIDATPVMGYGATKGVFTHLVERVTLGWDDAIAARWKCGGVAINPVFVDEQPTGREMCARCDAMVCAEPGVYFVERDGLIKIGRSNHPGRRALELRGSLLAVQAGDYGTEHQVHQRFAADRVTGEWFTPSPELLAHIADLRVAS